MPGFGTICSMCRKTNCECKPDYFEYWLPLIVLVAIGFALCMSKFITGKWFN